MDWEALARSLDPARHAGAGAPCVTPLTGGDINRACRLEFGAHCYFVKYNHARFETMFVAERRGLEVIRDSGTIRVPRVYQTGCDRQHAWIVMEYIELAGQPEPVALAQALAAMHACLRPQFGFECDNTIGSNPQPNPTGDDWIGFWRDARLGFQLELARSHGLETALIDAGLRLAQCLPAFFANYQPRASLLHGDLWSGNQGVDRDGNPVIYDPACYFGDHETDLAMMELFGHPGERFFAAYRERLPIDDGYALRRDLYNLYHLLNHANLFGGSYPAQSLRGIRRLLALVE